MQRVLAARPARHCPWSALRPLSSSRRQQNRRIVNGIETVLNLDHGDRPPVLKLDFDSGRNGDFDPDITIHPRVLLECGDVVHGELRVVGARPHTKARRTRSRRNGMAIPVTAGTRGG